MRVFVARALGVLLLVLAITLVWNGIAEVQWAEGVAFVVPILQLAAAPLAALGGHWAWRSDRRALWPTVSALLLATAAGTLAAWLYALPPDRSAAALGALGGGLAFALAVTLLLRLALPRSHDERAKV